MGRSWLRPEAPRSPRSRPCWTGSTFTTSSGYAVCFTWSTDEEQAGSTAAGLMAAGGRVVAVHADVADPGSAARAFDTAEAELGHVTAVVNNAGVTDPIGPFTSTSVADMRRVLDVNVLGALVVAREPVRRWDARASPGALVTISSIAATLGAPHEYVPYAPSKAAVEAMTVGLAKEVAARHPRQRRRTRDRPHRHPRRGRRARPARPRGVPRADGSDRGAGRDRERRPVAAVRRGVLRHGGGPAGVGGRVSPGSSDKAYIGWTPAAGRTGCVRDRCRPQRTAAGPAGRARMPLYWRRPVACARSPPTGYLAGGSVVISRRTTLFRD